MARVDQTKHAFDVLEHVLRGVHAATDDTDQLVIHEGVPPLVEREMREIRVLVRGQSSDDR